MEYDYELKYPPEDYYLYEGNYLTPDNELINLISFKDMNPFLNKELNSLIDRVEYIKLVRLLANEMLIEINNQKRLNLSNLNLESIYDKFFPYSRRGNKEVEANYNFIYFEAMALIINKKNNIDVNKLALPEYVNTQNLFRIELGLTDEEYLEYKKYHGMKF